MKVNNYSVSGKLSLNKKGDIVFKPSKKNRGDLVQKLRYKVEKHMGKVDIVVSENSEHYHLLSVQNHIHANQKEYMNNLYRKYGIITHEKRYTDLKPGDIFVLRYGDVIQTPNNELIFDINHIRGHVFVCMQYGNRKTAKECGTGRSFKEVLEESGIQFKGKEIMQAYIDGDFSVYVIDPASILSCMHDDDFLNYKLESIGDNSANDEDD